MSEIARLLAEDAKEKRQARGGLAVGKVSPRALVMPQDLDAAWWKRAPPVVWVRIADGAVLVFRWPLAENSSTLRSGPGQEGGGETGEMPGMRSGDAPGGPPAA